MALELLKRENDVFSNGAVRALAASVMTARPLTPASGHLPSRRV